MDLNNELIERGFINQLSTKKIEDIFDGKKHTIYHGIDPSADSAHAGNFVIWMLLKHLAQDGHKIIFLVGGGTGMIGDPKPNSEREIRSKELVEDNVNKLKTQALKLFEGCDVEFVNNFDWLSKIKLIDFLRDIGKHYTINDLIKKDAISARLKSDTGLSYTEFAYPLLQGYDFLELFKNKNCTVQVGGSDQWGNIISGVELVRRKEQAEVFAITVPLIIDRSTGKKFGKSEGNAVWLDAEKTSPYQFYQFWLNSQDEDVIGFLKLFTFLSLADISKIEVEFTSSPGDRAAQKKIAFEVTKIVHGEELAISSQKVSDILFSGEGVENISTQQKEMLLNGAPNSKFSGEMDIVSLLVEADLASSKREARTFVESGAVTINNKKIEDVECVVSTDFFINDIAILRRGKKKIHILIT